MVHGGEIYDKDIEYDFSVNLNPSPCPDEVMAAIERAMYAVHRYPDLTSGKFREMVAKAENRLAGGEYIGADNVIGGNGASELIMAMIRMIEPKNVLLPVPSFSGYMHGLAQIKGVKVREFFLREENDFELTDSFADEIDDDTDLIILANPNNPTGRAIDEKVMERIAARCEETGTRLLVDECFLHLSERAGSMIRYVDRMPGLFIVGAYTKLFSIPGVRVGYAISGRENIRKLSCFLPEWNMSVFAQNAGEACAGMLLETSFAEESKKLVGKKRRELESFLKTMEMKVFPSDSCFLLVKSEKDIYNILLKKKILIRDCSNFRGLTNGYYRISVSGSDVLQNPGLWAAD